MRGVKCKNCVNLKRTEWCELVLDSPHPDIERDCQYFREKTNADHIRSMTDEELAKILLDGCRGSKCDDQPENEWGSVNCFQCRMDWLKQPYKEDT